MTEIKYCEKCDAAFDEDQTQYLVQYPNESIPLKVCEDCRDVEMARRDEIAKINLKIVKLSSKMPTSGSHYKYW